MIPVWAIAKSIFGFGGERQLDTVDKTLGHIASGAKMVTEMIDEREFTPEEQSKANFKVVEQALEFQKATHEENSSRSKARRTIAVRWITFYLSLCSGYLVVTAAAIKWPALEKLMQAFMYIITLLGTGTLMVLGFYFGVHLLRGLKK